jgi:hypothetical protein
MEESVVVLSDVSFQHLCGGIEGSHQRILIKIVGAQVEI